MHSVVVALHKSNNLDITNIEHLRKSSSLGDALIVVYCGNDNVGVLLQSLKFVNFAFANIFDNKIDMMKFICNTFYDSDNFILSLRGRRIITSYEEEAIQKLGAEIVYLK